MTYSVRVADLPTTERPRERLQAQGARSLSTAELIAILLGTGQGSWKAVGGRVGAAHSAYAQC